VAVLVGLGAAKELGVLDSLGQPAVLAHELVDLGGWGYLAFVATYALLQPFGVPGTVFIFAAPLIWPWPVAFALSMAGTMAASVIGFSFVRFIARDWVASRIPARFRKYDDALERRGFTTVVALRFVFWMPQALHAFLAVSKVPFWTHFWGSLIGYLVPIFLVSYFGQKVWDALRSWPANVWVGVGVGCLIVALIAWAVRALRRRRAATTRRASVDAG